ncbi:hypothetical protein V5N11_029325 [Cardamine amara subsp. amara]|uniref:Uncharacterized protein n=1 Tax=Cardamine amara subsp. amara TaxID=228776 RepID=A0ABD1AG80_CARAN
MAVSAKFSLKLLVDEKRNKVVLAEADQDFVDVLFGLLTLPMGTIAGLLEKHQKLRFVFVNSAICILFNLKDPFKTNDFCLTRFINKKPCLVFVD